MSSLLSATNSTRNLGSALGVDAGGLPVAIAAGTHRPVGELLQRPAVAVGIGEVDEAAPRLLVDIAGLDPSPGEFGTDLVGVGDDHLEVVQRARRERGQPFADGDRAARAGRRELHEADVVADRVVLIGVESDAHVEVLGTVDVGDRHGHQLQLHVHVRRRYSPNVVNPWGRYALVLVLERDAQLGPEGGAAAVVEVEVLLDDLGHAQLADRLAGLLDRRQAGVLPRLGARPDDLDDLVDAHVASSRSVRRPHRRGCSIAERRGIGVPAYHRSVDRGFRRIAVVNRGEAAMRVINAVRELRIERGEALCTIAMHTEAERTAMFVREADESVCIDTGRAEGMGSPYLDLAALERALVDSGAEAAWVGWGFVAERPEFAELCERLGIVFVGPSAAVMRRLGDKIGSKLLAEQADVPVAGWSGGPVATLEEARIHATTIGYPLMVKATAGGGGRGIRRVDDESQLAEAFESARSEGGKAFGDPTVFMERVVTGARHVEVQLIADTHGTVWAVGVRDCSMQRRNQKVIEESHCIALTPEQDVELRAAAVRLASVAGYHNAGTVEFLYQPSERHFAFLEVNTRLQVEHPVTELTTGLDLVKLQLHVAAGGRLEGDPPPSTGYAIEARLNAEDPQRAFAPAPGTIETLQLPTGPGVRVDTGVAEGDVIPPEYDSMIAKVIAHGRDREEALGRLHRALSQTTVVVRGGTTNKSFLLDLLGRPEVRAGSIDTSWLDRLTAADEHLSARHVDVALVAAALDAGDLIAALDRASFLGWASRGRPRADVDIGRRIELRHSGQTYEIGLRQMSPSRHEVELDGVVAVVDVERLGRNRVLLTIAGQRYVVVSSSQGTDHLVEVDGAFHRFSRDDAGIVRAPATALVVGVDVAPDDVVAVGDRLGVVEAMKMEIAVPAPVAGRVRDVFVARNVQVDAGAPLFRIEPLEPTADAAPAGARIELTALRHDPGADSPRDRLATISAFILGFDVDAATVERVVAAVRDDPGPDDLELQILDAFADVAVVFPERRAPDAEGDEARGPREHFYTFLRSLDVEYEGLPGWYADRLRRAVNHYGVEELLPGAPLEAALLRLFIAQQRQDEQVPVVLALLDDLAAKASDGDPRLRETLDRLIEATRRRFPAVAAAARTVRHRRFDRPYVERAQAQVSTRMRHLAAAVAGHKPEDADRAAVDELVACPLPLVPIFAEDQLLSGTDEPGTLLEVLTRRYYKIRDLGPVTLGADDVLHTSYERHDRAVHVFAARARDDGLADALGALARATSTVAPPDTAVDRSVHAARRA